MNRMMRLSSNTLQDVPATVERFAYDRDAQAVGIVHFGIGAFHRAHQAWYTDRAMDGGDRDWAISGVSLRSRNVAQQMNPQDGLFTVTERSNAGDHIRVVGAVRNVIPAARGRRRVEGLIAARSTRVVSLTISEKGYCRAADGSLDFDLADGGSVFHFLASGLSRRRSTGKGGITLLSCDNLADNGEQLARLTSEYLDRYDPDLRAWFERECSCPSTMVDRIVPATTSDDLRDVAEKIGTSDAAAVFTEPFSQWVIEDRFSMGRPAWERVGAELVFDVAPYEKAKLRMLNGAHSALAYLGLAAGHEFVHQAVADPAIRPVVERLMFQEALPTIQAAPGQDLTAYGRGLFERFANATLRHRLVQIAMDGSQKIPQRWLETLAAQQGRGETCPAILTALAAWMRHIRDGGDRVSDPRSAELRSVWTQAGRDGIVAALFGEGEHMASPWAPDQQQSALLTEQL